MDGREPKMSIETSGEDQALIDEASQFINTQDKSLGLIGIIRNIWF